MNKFILDKALDTVTRYKVNLRAYNIDRAENLADGVMVIFDVRSGVYSRSSISSLNRAQRSSSR